MATKTAVDMHVKAEQTSATVKVAEGGVKLRVMARDRNWIQVTDPNGSTSGWIYNRFLTPAEPPAQ
jgi:SH3-like domain-containing protein